ncbi:MAG: nucleotidyltransferase family protein, partial [Thermoanaerobaculia bacterium]
MSAAAVRVHKAVVLARGLGSRMRQPDSAAKLDTAQAAAADTGMKAMIPFGRPFLDYVLSVLADAGLTEICLVVGPEHSAIRKYYTHTARPSRIRITFAIQQEPLGTADAVLAAEAFASGDHFTVFNSDNLYPLSACKSLAHMGRAGLPVFRRSTLVSVGNIPAERVRHYAVAVVSRDGFLERILEKPDEKTLASNADDAWISMNCWRFSPAIFQACREVGPSPLGELELPRAVDYAVVTLGQRFRAVPCRE